MKKMTEQNLREAFSAECCAHVRYLLYADRAETEGKPNIARMFRAVAFAEQVHAGNHLKTLGDIGGTADNLKSAEAGENYEIEEMYPAFDTVAKLQGELDTVQSIHYAIEAEKPHSLLFSEATAALKQNDSADIEDETYFICPNCGYTARQKSGGNCLICGNSTELFKEF